jgi:hypothetical protein
LVRLAAAFERAATSAMSTRTTTAAEGGRRGIVVVDARTGRPRTTGASGIVRTTG